MKSKTQRRPAGRKNKTLSASESAALPSAAQPQTPKSKRGVVPRDVATLMRAILRRKDPVELATELLEESSDTTKAKIFLQCLEYLYGKPVQQVETRPAAPEIPVRVITHIPRPRYPVQAPNPSDSTGLPMQAGPTNSDLHAPVPSGTGHAALTGPTNSEEESDRTEENQR